ncbi:hypothetical protein ACOMHN_008933 [Nucella lapillus]
MSMLRSILYSVLSAFTLVAGPVVLFVFRLIYGEKGPSVTKVTDPLLLQSATSLARKIRARQVRPGFGLALASPCCWVIFKPGAWWVVGQVSAEEVMEAFIRRAREVNPAVNAIVAERFSQALQEAREVDRVLSSGDVPEEFSEANKPFLGIPLSVKEAFALEESSETHKPFPGNPLSVKEAFALEGMPNCSGLVSRVGVRAERDSLAVGRLRRAGMIPFACTNVSELCMWYESNNTVYGRTNNAYDHTKIVGGSSGGEGCIISSGASLLGVGSDIGGSIRMPAFFNGVFGHRPSKDIVPNEGQHPPATGSQVELLATGPMCRYAQDLAASLRIMAGPDASRLRLDDKVDISQVKVYSMVDDGGSLFTGRVDPQLKDAQRKAFDHLISVGAQTTRPQCLPLMKYSLELWSAKMVSSNGTKFACFMAGGEHTGKKVNCFIELFKWLVRKSDHTLPAIGLGIAENFTPVDDPNIPKLLAMLATLRRELSTLLGDCGVLLYPSHPQPAPYHNLPLLTPFNFSYTAIFNALGLPVTQVPLGLSAQGLPLGIQVVGAPYQDRLTLAVAQELEKGMGGWVSPGI